MANWLQCSCCLEDPHGRGSLVAAAYGVAQSRTWLKWFNSSSNTLKYVLTIVAWSVLLRVFFVWFCSSFLIMLIFPLRLTIIESNVFKSPKLLLNFCISPFNHALFCFIFWGPVLCYTYIYKCYNFMIHDIFFILSIFILLVSFESSKLPVETMKLDLVFTQSDNSCLFECWTHSFLRLLLT